MAVNLTGKTVLFGNENSDRRDAYIPWWCTPPDIHWK